MPRASEPLRVKARARIPPGHRQSRIKRETQVCSWKQVEVSAAFSSNQ